MSAENLPTIPQIIMVDEHWKAIQGRIEAGETVSLKFDIRNHFDKGPSPFYNVIADIPGTEFPDEYVIVGAHIDSWDSATGTVDDGIGTAVAMAGSIVFVGLVVPHILRMLIGPDHRALIPACALSGAGLLMLADTAARLVIAPSELPVGVVTALIGVPFFVSLLRRRHQYGMQ